MYLYKCKCGLLTSEDFQICPSCGNEENKILESTYNLNEEVFRLTMEDVNSVIKELNLTYVPGNISQEMLRDIVRGMEIPWMDYIECVLEARFKTIS